MNILQNIVPTNVDDIASIVARKNKITQGMVWSFTDSTDVLTSLLSLYYKPGINLIAAGHVGPAVEIAADRAEIALKETMGFSPFNGDIDSALDAVTSQDDIIYVSNPNRITGANFSLAELDRLAQAVPEGILIINEYYYDYFGISAIPLLESSNNIVIFRSFTSSFGIRSSDIGYVIATSNTIDRIKETFPEVKLSAIVRKTIMATLVNDFALQNYLDEIHDEGLRIGLELNRLGVQCRLTATDFVLLRIADPASVGNHLASRKVTIENLDGYPQLNNYVQYRIQSPSSNDNMLGAFNKMPMNLYRMKSFDRRAIKMRLNKHNTLSDNDRVQHTAKSYMRNSRNLDRQPEEREMAYSAKSPMRKHKPRHNKNVPI